MNFFSFHLIARQAICIVCLATTTMARGGESDLAILPDQIILNGQSAQQRLIVLNSVNGSFQGEWVDEVVLESSNPQIVAIQEHVAQPMSNGQATITAILGSQTAVAKVTVVNMEQPVVRSLRNDVLSVFAKLGCNSGACHGALAGKGGFKLSLRGYDPVGDYTAIAVHARGRRIELSDPGRSLILAKPSGAIPHGGGIRFEVDSPAYKIIADWIAQGAPPPDHDDIRVDRIEVLPEQLILQPHDEHQLIVRAHYTDGHFRDVTPWATFESVDLSVTSVDDAGRIQVTGPGGGSVTARFASNIAIAHVIVPYDTELDEQTFENLEAQNFIDQLVTVKLKQLKLPVSPAASDQSFLRRAYLDTLGTLPTPDEVRSYLADPSPNKRTVLIDTLLARPEFVDYWSYKWSDLLLVSGLHLRPEPLKVYYHFIRQHVEQNTPWNEFVQKVITAQGGTMDQGAVNFYSLHEDAESMTENVCQAFLGLSIGCAKCHNHPLEKWTNDQYYAMASFFARVRSKGWGGDPRRGDGIRTVFVARSGELLQPRTGKPQPPTPLDAEPLSVDSIGDRRQYVAQWLTSAENPYFARSIANRVWANFLNVGLVEQIDDMRDTNPASNERLLSALADYLVEHDFDLKQLMKAILNSSTYGRSSRPLPGNLADSRFYSRYYPKRLMAEVLLDAISQVTGVPTPFTHLELPNSRQEETKFYPEGTRAVQLYDSAVASPFLKSFGRNPRNITCECERSDEPSMVQVFHIANGDTIHGKLQEEGNRVDQLLAKDLPTDKLVKEVYLAALSRYPTDLEIQRLLPVLNGSITSSRREVVEDLFWSVMSSREFLFGQ